MPEVTVFIITCGEESFSECRAAIDRQTLRRCGDVPVELIRDVFPMSEAFNEMHRRCRTPYFIQIDADMILNDDALEILYEGIKKSLFFHYVAYGQLFEEGFGPGGTVRCWKKNFFRFFQFRDCRTVDRDLFQRARRFGLQRKNLKKALGIHRPRHSAFSEYLKAKSDVEKWRFLKRSPQQYALPLLQELCRDREANRYKLLGFLLGALTCEARVRRSKNIEIEKESLGNLLRLFGYSSFEELRLVSTVLDQNAVADLFTQTYRAPNKENQAQLIAMIVRLFSKVESVSTEAVTAEVS